MKAKQNKEASISDPSRGKAMVFVSINSTE